MTDKYAGYPEEFITPPAREPDGEFHCMTTWECKARSWIGGTNALCVDAKNRRLRVGAQFMRADDEGAFPVRFWWGEGDDKPQKGKLTPREKALRQLYPERYKR